MDQQSNCITVEIGRFNQGRATIDVHACGETSYRGRVIADRGRTAGDLDACTTATTGQVTAGNQYCARQYFNRRRRAIDRVGYRGRTTVNLNSHAAGTEAGVTGYQDVTVRRTHAHVHVDRIVAERIARDRGPGHRLGYHWIRMVIDHDAARVVG